MTRFECGHRHVLTRQLVLAPRRRRGGENAGERVLALGARTRQPGRAVEQLLGGLPADPGGMACVHLMSFSVNSLIDVTAAGGAGPDCRCVARVRRPR